MESIDREGLHPSCHDGGDCCENPCGPVYLYGEVIQPAEATATGQEEMKEEQVKKFGKIRSIGHRVMALLA